MEAFIAVNRLKVFPWNAMQAFQWWEGTMSDEVVKIVRKEGTGTAAKGGKRWT